MTKLSLLFPDQDRITYQMIPEETWHDLGMDALTAKLAAEPQELQVIRQVMRSLTADPRAAAFRAGVFEDMLRHPEIRKQMTELLLSIQTFYEYRVIRRREDDGGIWDLVHRLGEYHDYIVTVEKIRECLEDRDLRSEGMQRLRDTVEEIYHDNGFAALKKDVEEMRITASQVRSLTLGINLNERFEAVNMGLVSVNAKPFSQSGILKNFLSAVTPKEEVRPEADWDKNYTFYPASSTPGNPDKLTGAVEAHALFTNPIAMMSLSAVPMTDGASTVTRQVDTAATMLMTRISKKLRTTLAKYLNVSVKDISDLIPELTFYTRWAEFIEKSRAEGWTFSRPEVLPDQNGPARMEAKGFYNLKLMESETPENVVKNDLTFDAKKRVYILTGANRGGKTTFTQAVGQLLILAQCGIFVPAEEFRFDPADLVLTHFPADEDKTLDLGRLGEECRRFRELFGKSTEKSLILLNETFSTTSFEEGYYIAVDAVKAILQKDARTIYNTHMHKLAKELDTEINTDGAVGKAVSLVAETKEGKNSFRVRIAPPEGKSFAREIAAKYGVTYEALTEA
ncbi:MAG: DNA mismatch repair protein [Lachnospiraceae bacterium]|nr:DNA mismatch repair protein [Lachnospiraceae bacterium]